MGWRARGRGRGRGFHKTSRIHTDMKIENCACIVNIGKEDNDGGVLNFVFFTSISTAMAKKVKLKG